MTSHDLLAQFDREMATTRRVLSRVPNALLEWRPHPKSTTMLGIARHLAHMVTYGPLALTEEASDIASRTPMPVTTSIETVLEIFDRNVAAVHELLAGQSDADLAKPWSLTYQGKAVVAATREVAIQSMILHHQIHHRGQLSVYLRLNDVPVPAIYGPSADEAMQA